MEQSFILTSSFCVVANRGKLDFLDKSLYKDTKIFVFLMQDEEKCLLMVNEVMEEQQHLKDRLMTQKSEVTKAQSEIEEARKILLALNK